MRAERVEARAARHVTHESASATERVRDLARASGGAEVVVGRERHQTARRLEARAARDLLAAVERVRAQPCSAPSLSIVAAAARASPRVLAFEFRISRRSRRLSAAAHVRRREASRFEHGDRRGRRGAAVP